MNCISVRNVIFNYDSFNVIDGLNFSIDCGEKYSLIGANGSGKSTTLKILAGLLRPISGEVEILGNNPENQDVKRKIGYLPEDASPYRLLSVRENVEYAAALRGVEDVRDSADSIMEYFDVRGYERIKSSKLSRGKLQRLSLSMALVHKPEIMILDEPLNYLDVPTQEKTVKLLRSSKSTVFVSTHILSTANRLTDHIMILSSGRISWSGTLAEINEEGDSAETLETKVARMMNGRA